MIHKLKVLSVFTMTMILISISVDLSAKKKPVTEKDSLSSSTFSGLKFRSIGPAFTSGRISDFAVNPENHTLKNKGLIFVGLDVIGDYLTEINVTSPTCVQELDRKFGLNIAGQLMDHIEQKLRH